VWLADLDQQKRDAAELPIYISESALRSQAIPCPRDALNGFPPEFLAHEPTGELALECKMPEGPVCDAGLLNSQVCGSDCTTVCGWNCAAGSNCVAPTACADGCITRRACYNSKVCRPDCTTGTACISSADCEAAGGTCVPVPTFKQPAARTVNANLTGFLVQHFAPIAYNPFIEMDYTLASLSNTRQACASNTDLLSIKQTYAEIVKKLREVAPAVPVFPTWKLEEHHPEYITALDEYRLDGPGTPKAAVDIIALSTYPYGGLPVSEFSLPPHNRADYFDAYPRVDGKAVAGRRPLAISETGIWAASPPYANQAAFVDWLVSEGHRLRMPFLINYFFYDYPVTVNLGTCCDSPAATSCPPSMWCLSNSGCNAQYPACVFRTNECCTLMFPYGFVDNAKSFQVRPALAIFDAVVSEPPPLQRLSHLETDVDGRVDDDSGLIVHGLRGARAVEVSPDGHHVYVGGRTGVALFQRKLLTGRLVFVETYRHAIARGLGAAEVNAIAVDAQYAYVLSSNAVAIFKRSPLTGKLARSSSHRLITTVYKDRRHLAGGSAIALSAPAMDGSTHVYVSADTSNALLALQWTPRTSTVAPIGKAILSTATDNLGTLRPKSVALSPDGAYVYVASGRRSHESVSAFARDPNSGKLSPAPVVTIQDPRKLKGIRSLAVSPSGQYVYAVGTTNTLAVLKWDGGSLALDSVLTSTSGRDELAGAAAVTAGTGAADSYLPGSQGAGEYVYVAGKHAVVMFHHDPRTGALQFDGSTRDANVLSASTAALSPDGRYLYATGISNGGRAIAAFWTTD